MSVRDERSSAARVWLAGHPMTRGLDAAQVEQLAGRARLVRFGDGERIIQEGTVGDSLILIVSGRADVAKNDEAHAALTATSRKRSSVA